MQPLIVIEI